MALSRKTKESIKTALAMTIVYWAALSLDWDNPKWAGFTVAFISLSTLGQSLNKALLRMLGTVTACAASLTMFALFPQERWLFFISFSIYIGFCTYKTGGGNHPYFWNCAGFVAAIICMGVVSDPTNAFQTAILRTKETGLGILVYSLVAVFLWPSASKGQFEASARELASVLSRFYSGCFESTAGADDEKKLEDLKKQTVQRKNMFDQMLDAAETDSYEIWESRDGWRRFQRVSARLLETMERWRGNASMAGPRELRSSMPGLAAFDIELTERFDQIDRMLGDQPPEKPPAEVDLSPDIGKIQAMTSFQTAATAVVRSRILQMEALTRSMFGIVSEIKGFGDAESSEGLTAGPKPGFVVDPDRLKAAFQAAISVWGAILVWIYVGDAPGGSGIVSLTASLAITLANMPQLSAFQAFVPLLTSIVFAGVVHMLIMTQLSSFMGLGILIFLVIFAICFLFAEPEKMLGKAAGLAMFFSVTAVSNQQVYSFFLFANIALMGSLGILILAACACIVRSPRPEVEFQKLLERFFRSCEQLANASRPRPRTGVLGSWLRRFHLFQISTIPKKLAAWSRFAASKAPGAASPELVETLVQNIALIGDRLEELLEETGDLRPDSSREELYNEIAAWRRNLRDVFASLAADPAAGDREAYRAGLVKIMERIEAHLKELLADTLDAKLEARSAESFFRMAGAYRGVSERIVKYAETAEAVEWSRWREDRF